MADMVKVYFIKAGTPYGYGYAIGEFGLVRKEDMDDRTYTDEKGKEHVKPGLLSRGIVRQATESEYQKAMGVEAEKVAARAPKAPKAAKASGKAAKQAEGPESGAEGGDEPG